MIGEIETHRYTSEPQGITPPRRFQQGIRRIDGSCGVHAVHAGSDQAISVAVGTSVTVGLFPDRRAADLDPVQALRFE